MNKSEQVAVINSAAVLLEFVKKHLTAEQAEEVQTAINKLDTICDNIKQK